MGEELSLLFFRGGGKNRIGLGAERSKMFVLFFRIRRPASHRGVSSYHLDGEGGATEAKTDVGGERERADERLVRCGNTQL